MVVVLCGVVVVMVWCGGDDVMCGVVVVTGDV